MAKIERRFVPAEGIECRKDADGTHIVGYGAVYYRADDAGTQYELWPGVFERIMPGAFDRAIKEDDVRGTFNHDPSQILGRTPRTMRIVSDKRGTRYDITVPDTQLGRDLPVLLERGDINGSSFGFNVPPGGDKWHMENGAEVRELHSLKVYDMGPVTCPAYQSTSAGIRTDGDPVEARASYEAWKAGTALAPSGSDVAEPVELVADDAETRSVADPAVTVEFPLKEARRRRLANAGKALTARVRAKLESDMDARVRGNVPLQSARRQAALARIDEATDAYRDMEALGPIFDAIERVRAEQAPDA